MIAAYLRVSSKSQDLRMQREAITRASNARGERITDWFCDKTPGVGERPELNRLRKLVRGGGVDAVWVYRLDRLSRVMLEMLNLVHEFRHVGCRLETVSDGFPLEGPGSDIVLAVLAWVAEYERGIIRERMKAARVAHEAAGGHWGRPARLRDGRRIEEVRELKRKGRTVREIAQALKLPRSTVSDILSEKGVYAKTTSDHSFSRKKTGAGVRKR